MFVHRSSSLEELIARLDENLKAPGLRLLEPETILIQSAGMERYLSRELARKSRIAANIRYPFPRAFLHEVLNRSLSPSDTGEAFERKNLSWALFVNLERHAKSSDPVFAPLRRALLDDADGLQRLILAEQLAHLFDQYLTYRPRMVLKWQTGAAPAEMQAILWRELVSQLGEQHFAARCHRFLNEISDEEIRAAVPARVSLLGGPGLPALFLQMLRRIGRVVPTHVYAFAVCEQYFADAHPLSDLELTVDEDLHPLLLSLGRVGADFQRSLESVGEYEEGEASFVYPQVNSLLTALQQSLINGALPNDGQAVKQCASFDLGTDHSITLDSCHSRLREVEVLHDRILGWFQQDPSLRPEDVVVLAPDIEQYSALISAVFDARAGTRPKIPFRIADRSERSTNVAARSLLLALRLLRGRFRASEVLDLFQEGPVQARYGVETSDLEKVSAWVQGSGIRWGVDGAHRAELDLPPYAENTWRFGLRRLFLGYALFDEGEQIFDGVVPFDAMPASDLPLLGQFTDFCESLFSLRQRLTRAPPSGLTSEEWVVFMADLVRALLPDGSEGEWELSPLIASLAELSERPRLVSEKTSAECEIRWGLSAMLHLLEEELISMRPSTEFLSGGVTFCTLLPLRTIPFRALCVLGLNQGEFPRSDRPHPFDLMASDPKHGDRSLRADDNYLFMEVLLAAREKLALSYVGRSVQDNAVQPPSTVVTQLREALTRLCTPLANKEASQELNLLPTTQHPLQPFAFAYFERGNTGLQSFDEEAYVAARSLSQEQKPVDAFFLNDEEEGADVDLQALASEVVELSLAEIIAFWKDPARAYLLARGVRIDDEPAQLEDREPVEPSFLTNYQVGERLLARLSQVGSVRSDVELGRGDLPIGRGGEALLTTLKGAAESIGEQAERFRGAAHPPVDLNLRFAPLTSAASNGVPMYKGAFVITGALRNLFGDHGLEVSYGKVTPKRILSLWIHHLAACAQGTEISASVLVARGGSEQTNGVEVFGLSQLTKEQALAELSTLGRIAIQGRSVPLPFFPVASQIYVESLRTPSKKLSEQEQIHVALKKARASLIDKNKPGEMDAHLVQLYRGVVPLSLDESDEAQLQLFRKVSDLVFHPLLKRAESYEDSAPAQGRVK